MFLFLLGFVVITASAQGNKPSQWSVSLGNVEDTTTANLLRNSDKLRHLSYSLGKQIPADSTQADIVGSIYMVWDGFLSNELFKTIIKEKKSIDGLAMLSLDKKAIDKIAFKNGGCSPLRFDYTYAERNGEKEGNGYIMSAMTLYPQEISINGISTNELGEIRNRTSQEKRIGLIEPQSATDDFVATLLIDGISYPISRIMTEFYNLIGESSTPSSDVLGGVFSVSVDKTSDPLLQKWAMDETLLKDGVIEFKNKKGNIVFFIKLHQAQCIHLTTRRSMNEKSTTEIIIRSKSLDFNGERIDIQTE